MQALQGFKDYMHDGMTESVFDEATQNGSPICLLHCQDGKLTGIIAACSTYDIKFIPALDQSGIPPPADPQACESHGMPTAGPVENNQPDADGAPNPDGDSANPQNPTAPPVQPSGAPPIVIPKVEILLVCAPGNADTLGGSKKGQPFTATPTPPLIRPKDRNYIKNRTLFTLMMERQVFEITLLNNMQVRGLADGFNLYEIRMHLKGGIPVTILRHGILSAQTKTGRSLLKTDQARLKDWKKSSLFKEIIPQTHKDKAAAGKANKPKQSTKPPGV